MLVEGADSESPPLPRSVDGGELFDRIIDDNCNLTELDTILFIRQICEGIRHMHQMYILHLDLKVGLARPQGDASPSPRRVRGPSGTGHPLGRRSPSLGMYSGI